MIRLVERLSRKSARLAVREGFSVEEAVTEAIGEHHPVSEDPAAARAVLEALGAPVPAGDEEAMREAFWQLAQAVERAVFEGDLVVRWDVSEWQDSHGSGPRGRGSWAFRQRGMTPGDLMWSPAGMTYAEARAWARKELEDRGHRGFVELVVCS